MAFYYLILAIITSIIKKIIFLFYFIAGLVISIAMTLGLFAINKGFAICTGILIALEIAIFLIILKLTICKNKLEENHF